MFVMCLREREEGWKIVLVLDCNIGFEDNVEDVLGL